MTNAPSTPSATAIETAIDAGKAERAQALAAFFAALRKPALPTGAAQPA